MHSVTNPIQACNDIFFRPNGVFAALAKHNNWSWVPFILVVVMAILPNYLYINFVDYSWYQDLIINSQFGDKSPAEQDMARQQMSRESGLIFAMVGTFVMLIVVNAIVAGYLTLTTRGDEECVQGYTDWYGFTWWTAMPMLINSLVAVVLILIASDHQIQPSVIAPLSAAYAFGVEMSSSWFGLAQSIRLDSLWGIYLTTVGITQWTSFSTKKAAIIAVAPWTVIWLIWLAFLMAA